MQIKRLLGFSLPFLFLLPFTITAEDAVIGVVGETTTAAVVVRDPETGLPVPDQDVITGLPVGAQPHGISPAGPNQALVSDFALFRVHVVAVSTNSRLFTINTPAYSGTGTIAVNPAVTHALACGSANLASDNTLTVIQAPFTNGSSISTVQLPGTIPSYQTQAIVFDPAGRAFVFNTVGISVLDPPYTSILFTIAYPNTPFSGAIAITPDGNTLLVTNHTNVIGVFSAPFSVSSTATAISTKGNQLDGIMVAPDGQNAVVGNLFPARVFIVPSPFSSTSSGSTSSKTSSTLAKKVKEVILPSEFADDPGFEDVAISSDSQVAILTGNSTGEDNGHPAAFVTGFASANRSTTDTAAVPTAVAVNINGGGRGAGAVRFVLVPSFSLQCSPASFTSVASVNLNSTCTVRSIDGFTGSVDLACTNLPNGFNCGFDTDPVTLTSSAAISNLTIGVGGVPIGDYNFNVRGTDGSIIKIANVAVKVVVPVFQDNFTDGNADGWVLTGGDWQVVSNPRPASENATTAGNALQGTVDGKGSAISPDFNLGIGTVEADVVVGTPGAKVSFLTWFMDKKNLVEFQILEAKEKFILKQKGGGASGKQVFKRTIDPNTNIHIKINFDGTKFDVFVDGSTTPDITMPAVAQPNGKVGLQIKSDGSATASITNVIAY